MREICWIIAALGALAGCASGGPGGGAGSAGEPSARSFVYDCGQHRFRVQVGAGVARVTGPDGRQRTLQPARAASGAKYQGEDALYWSKGESALFQWNGRRFEGCAENPRATVWADAASRGVDFRALGNEPGWLLEVRDGGHLTFVGDYGARRVLVENPGAETRADATVYDAATPQHRLRVVIRRQRCQDTMSGEAFEARVEVTLDGTTYRGCGNWLPWSPGPERY